ncbi:MAG: hypothetical protein DELT_03011 [Desulfovibrio sp.]|uniref:GNAT family N-acetyltransferase n=1 Tax=Christensenella intestinihominis TaxID=1851429 RepID=UPI0008308171|nr:GNAT family N-acetyltransferase [Christensenella intestinihominis]
MITNQWFCGLSDDVRTIRENVFVREQGFPPEEEFDVFDDQAMHVVIYDGEKPVGTGRVYHDGKTFRIGRVCVLREERGQGIGDLVMRVLLVKAFGFNPSQVCVDAQVHAKAFYENFGFEQDGEETSEAGVPHIPMRVTKDTLVFKSGCGKEMRFREIFPEKG